MARTKPREPMTRLLMGYGLDSVTLASVLGCSRPTAKGRLQDPGRLTLAELRDICIRGGVPADEIRQAVRLCR